MGFELAERHGMAPSGFAVVPSIAWGSHLCHFYRTAEELRRVLVPFFAAGLANRERCVWVASDPMPASAARAALAAVMPDLAERMARRDIEILDFDRWYTAAGTLSVDRVLGTWLERERAALADGYTGLRITGNTSFLAREDLPAFHAYETAVHRAFRGRRIIAVCSYALPRCTADDAIEALRHHGAALIEHAGHLEYATSATSLLEALQERHAGSTQAQWSHALQLLPPDAYPAAQIAGFLADGIRLDEAAVAIATRDHLEQILAACEHERLATGRLAELNRFVALDADDVLADLMVEGRPDPVRFRQTVATVVEALAAGGRSVRAYGEMVDVLWRRGEEDAALGLERLWSELINRIPVRLICGYSAEHFRPDHGGVVPDVCAEHEIVWDDMQHAAGIAEQMLSASHRRLRELQRATSALCAAITLGDVRRVVAEEIARILRASSAQILVANEAARDVGGPAARAFSSGAAVWHTEPGTEGYLPLAIDGRPLGVLHIAFDAGRTVGTIDRALFQDVATLTAASVDRAQMYEIAEAANREKDQFLALLGHELRNPLAPILTALQLMKLRGDRALVKERELIERQVTHMARLVDDLLDLSRITRGKLAIRRSAVQLNGLLAEAIEAASPLIEQRGHRLIVSERAPVIWIEADRTRIVQALANILTNAAKYTAPGGQLTISLTESGGRAVVSVRDTGAGLAPEMLAEIFEPFVQADRTVERAQGGLGLGLALVRRLVELHGGCVRAFSEGIGRGSEFQIELEAIDPPQAAVDTAPGAATHRRGSDRTALQVLVVDDNADAADMLAEVLRAHGCEPHVAYDGAQAIDCARRQHIDVALLDLDLPIIGGHEVARLLQEQQAGRPIRLIALSGFGTADDQERTQRAGFAAHLVKPVDIPALLGLIATAGVDSAPREVQSGR
jgi:signal transduction histidine kinase/ActR/RegA family two-component response regulator